MAGSSFEPARHAAARTKQRKPASGGAGRYGRRRSRNKEEEGRRVTGLILQPADGDLRSGRRAEPKPLAGGRVMTKKKKRIGETLLKQNERLNSSFWLPVMERNGDEEETTARRSRAVRDQRQTGVRPLQDGRVGLRLCTCVDMRCRAGPLQDAP